MEEKHCCVDTDSLLLSAAHLKVFGWFQGQFEVCDWVWPSEGLQQNRCEIVSINKRPFL